MTRLNQRESSIVKASLLIALASLAWGNAQAHDARCDAEPYSVPSANYPALVRLITNLFGTPKTEIIANICDIKYNASDRTPLYKLGITDEQINETDTGTLVVKMLEALKKVLGAQPSEKGTALIDTHSPPQARNDPGHPPR
jgi:hypothetical protein